MSDNYFPFIYNEISNKKLYEGIVIQYKLAFPHLGSRQINLKAYEQYKAIGGKIREEKEVKHINNFVNTTLPTILDNKGNDVGVDYNCNTNSNYKITITGVNTLPMPSICKDVPDGRKWD